jgi:dihydrolipoamide dehydrogenase
MFGDGDVMRYDAVPSVIYTRPEAAGVGLTEQQALKAQVACRKQLIPLKVAGRFLAEHAGEQGYVKVLAGQEDRKLLGVHILGGPAGEMIFAAAGWLEQGLRTGDIAGTIFPHPTVSEALKAAILSV